MCLLLVASAPAAAGQLTWTHRMSSQNLSFQKAPDGDRIVAAGADYEYVSAPGEPLVPFRVISMLLPPGETVVNVDVDATPAVTLATGVKPVIAPIAAEDGSIPASAAVFNADTAYPAERAVFLGVGHLHGFTIASFAVYPARIDRGTLSVSEALTLRITTGPDASGVRIAQRTRARENLRENVERMLDGLVVNPDLAASYPHTGTPARKTGGGFQPTSFPSLEGSDVDYVIITNDSLAASFQTLADWKTAK